MSSLSVPQQQPSGSATTHHSSTVEHNDDLAPMTHSRRGSMADSAQASHSSVNVAPGAPQSAAARAGLIPLPPGQIQAFAENAALTSPVDWKESDHYQGNHVAGTDQNAPNTTILVGKDQRPFHISTDLLKQKSPYFARAFSEHNGHSGCIAAAASTTFDDLDEFGMGLFMHWLSSHGNLHGPHDFHSLAHYLSLYVLARKFEIEQLENQVMDLVRHYYSTQNMTAPAYRLEYMYTYTHSPNKMRDFLVSTAAFRALEDSHAPDSISHAGPGLHKTFYAPGSYVSDSTRAVLMKYSDMAMDFIETLVKLHRCGEHDARHGQNCEWHVHDTTAKCKEDNLEPWQSDGAGDDKSAKKDDTPAAPGGPVGPAIPAAPKPAKPADKPEPAAPAKPANAAKPAADAKNDDGPFKSFGKKMKGHVDSAKDKLHSKKDKAADKPKDDKKDEKKDEKDDKKPADKPKADQAAAAPPAKK